MVGYRVSVAKFQRPEADATNQPIAYQTRPLNWTFGNPGNPLGAKCQGFNVPKGGGRVVVKGGLFPVHNPEKTYVSSSHRKNLPSYPSKISPARTTQCRRQRAQSTAF